MTSTSNTPTRPAPATRAPATRSWPFRMILRVVARLHRWAESGWAGSAVGAWGVLQSSVVPGPADALIAPLGLADPPRVWRLVGWAIAGSVVGGLIAYGIGAFALTEVGLPIFRLFGAGPEELVAIERQFARQGWIWVFASALTPIPTKLVCIAAGAFGVSPLQFTLALATGRTVRFLVIGALVYFAGERLTRRLERLVR